jgi:hypothetical protein
MFGDWLKSSCIKKEMAGFNAFLDEIAVLLVPQLLFNQPPQSAEQVQDSAYTFVWSPQLF